MILIGKLRKSLHERKEFSSNEKYSVRLSNICLILIFINFYY